MSRDTTHDLISDVCEATRYPAPGRGGLYIYEISKLPHCIDNRLTDGGKVVSRTRQPRFTHKKSSDTNFCFNDRVNRRVMVWLEGLSKLKKFNNLFGTRT
jgi:hypothetical protein